MSAPTPAPQPSAQSHADDGDEQDSRKRKAHSSADNEVNANESSSEIAAKQPRLDSGDRMTRASAAASSSSSVAVDDQHAPPHTSAMLTCLSTHRDMQFSLMQMLELEDLAKLDATCRTWRAWLLHPPLLSGLNYELQSVWPRLQAMLQSRWLPQMVTSAHQQLFQCELAGLDFSRGILEDLQQQCTLMLQLLSRCTRLRRLVPRLVCVPQTALDACFGSIAGNLRVLCVRAQGSDAELLPSLFRALHPLRSLVDLQVTTDNVAQHVMSSIDFSALPLMPHLNVFRLWHEDHIMHTFRCTPTQVRTLTQCRSLVRFICGCWSPDERTHDDDGQLQPSVKQQILDGIGALASGWLDAPAAASSSSAGAHSGIAIDATSMRLEYLNLLPTHMTRDVWTHVSRLTSLTELWPNGWSPDMTATQWAQLTHFTRLHNLNIMPNPCESWLQSEHIVPTLLRCTQLRALGLGRMDVSREQLHAICTGLPLLKMLTLDQVQAEDCEPLNLASSLDQLELICCSGPDDMPVQFRVVLPPLAQLTRLTIWEPDDQQLTEAQAAPLNAALLARMPKLTPERFSQSLLPAPAPAPAVAPAPPDVPSA